MRYKSAVDLWPWRRLSQDWAHGRVNVGRNLYQWDGSMPSPGNLLKKRTLVGCFGLFFLVFVLATARAHHCFLDILQ